MWPFRHESWRERLSTVEERIESQDRQLRGLQLEWSETYDKLQRLYGRLVKRDELDARRSPKAEAEPPLALTSDVPQVATSEVEKGRLLAQIRGSRGVLPR